MYGLNKDNVSIQTRNFFPVAVDNKCHLESATVIEKNGGYNTIDFIFTQNTNEGVAKTTFTAWEVNEDAITENNGKTREENLANAYKSLNTTLLHVATKVNCTDADIKKLSTSDSFKSFAAAYCDMINAKIKTNNPELYLKTYRDKTGYSKVAKFVPFLQRVDEGSCKLSWTKQEIAGNVVAVPTNGVAEAVDNI